MGVYFKSIPSKNITNHTLVNLLSQKLGHNPYHAY